MSTESLTQTLNDNDVYFRDGEKTLRPVILSDEIAEVTGVVYSSLAILIETGLEGYGRGIRGVQQGLLAHAEKHLPDAGQCLKRGMRPFVSGKFHIEYDCRNVLHS